MTAIQAVSDYMDYATFHGVGRTKNAPYKLFKVVWILALCGSLGMITWQVHTLYTQLKSYPISTWVEVKTDKSLRFPRIILCNTNPASYDKIPPGSNLGDVVQEASNKYSISLSIFNETDLYGYNYSTYDMETKDTNISEDILFSTSEHFKMKLAVKDLPQLKSISQSVDEFVMICNFAGQPCDKNAFTIKRSYDYGLCYEFDSANQRGLKPHGKISAAGPRYCKFVTAGSLEMLLYVNEGDSIPFVTSSTGVVFAAEATNTNFHPENSVLIPTGFEANIALTQFQQKRVPGKSETKRCNDNAWADSLLIMNNICEHCSAPFNTRAAMRVHCKAIHQKAFPYKCCGKGFRDKTELRRRSEFNLPYSKCDEIRDNLKKRRTANYTTFWKNQLVDCHEKCKQLYVSSRCNCYKHFFDFGTLNSSIPLNETHDKETGYRPCYTEDDYKCILATVEELATMSTDLCLGCLPPCDEVLIEHEISMVKWPGNNFIPILRRILKNKLTNFDPAKLDREFVRSNMVLVRWYMSSLSYSVMEEEYDYTDVDFISDIGGQLGLWAGCSVLSLLEVVELCFLLCASFRGKKTSPENSEAEDAVNPDKNALK